MPDYDIEHFFSPTEFTQVNHAINRVLVRRALTLLDPQPGERVADMFCGLGNFTLPIARSGARVVGIGLAEEIVTTFISTAFEGGRHARRVAMLTELENEF